MRLPACLPASQPVCSLSDGTPCPKASWLEGASVFPLQERQQRIHRADVDVDAVAVAVVVVAVAMPLKPVVEVAERCSGMESDSGAYAFS